MKHLNIFTKTFLYTLGMMTLIVVIVHLMAYSLLPTFFLKEKTKELEVQSEELLQQLSTVPLEEMQEIAGKFAMHYNVNIMITDGVELYEFQGFTPFTIQFDPRTELSELPLEEPDKIMEEDLHHVIIEENRIEGLDRAYTVYMIGNIQPVSQLKQITLSLLPYSLVISFIISLVAAYIFSRLFTNPIKRMAGVTKEMKKLQANVSCEVESKDEIGMLANNMNELYDTLLQTISSLEAELATNRAIEKEKILFLRAASHELKTPLTALHILMENMRYKVGKYKDRDLYLEQAASIVQEASVMVQDVLDTSKLQQLQVGEGSITSMKEVILPFIHTYDVIAKAKSIHLHVEIMEDWTIHLSEEALEKVVSNILANAVMYTEEHGKVELKLTEESLTIYNECQPIEASIEQLFKPFYRLDESRNKLDGGTGLGLYIVATILEEAHIPFSFQAVEEGMLFTIEKP